MEQIGFFVSTFGGGGVLIWYLINERRTTDKSNVEATNKNTQTLEKQTNAIDDMTESVQDLLDYLKPDHNKERRAKELRSRLTQRKYERSDKNN